MKAARDKADGAPAAARRAIPQVDAVLSTTCCTELLSKYRRDVVKRLVQEQLAQVRGRLAEGGDAAVPTAHEVAHAVGERLELLSKRGLRPVVNATGVILHTNLGRAVLSPAAQRALGDVAAGYSNLEMDLQTGKRTHRDVHLERLLRALTGAEAATVVNNNAAAVFLVLSVFAAGREVVTSRGELIEIGGSFRIPDIVRAAGCTLVEVGTTNRTRLGDYERALSDRTALILKTHPSNYRVRGFIEEAQLPDLVGLGRKHGIPVYMDLGSGYLAPEPGPALPEPDVCFTLVSGADIVSFSGDKLLGGPQAGVILGSAEAVKRLRSSPIWRAMRIDKLTAAAMEATLAGHLSIGGGSVAAVQRPANELTAGAERLAAMLREAAPAWQVNVAAGDGYYGGGSLPDEALPSALVIIAPQGLAADELDQRLRDGDPPVVGYVQRGSFILNTLSLLPGDDERVVQRVREILHA